MPTRSDHLSLQDLSAGDGRYAFERKLGEGGSGAVYLVRDRETGEQLALKRLHRADDRSIARLKREFRSLANINHRNVIRLYDLGRAVDGWFLTMEYVDGNDLLRHLEIDAAVSAILKRGGDVPELDSGHIGRIAVAFHQLASGVIALHREGVLHRDLKPSNVLVADKRVVVLDFGLALEVGDGASRITMDGTITAATATSVRKSCWTAPRSWSAPSQADSYAATFALRARCARSCRHASTKSSNSPARPSDCFARRARRTRASITTV